MCCENKIICGGIFFEFKIIAENDIAKELALNLFNSTSNITIVSKAETAFNTLKSNDYAVAYITTFRDDVYYFFSYFCLANW